jgi:hypothetical protein
MTDPFTDFLTDMPEPRPRTRKARVSDRNPYSQNPDDPYVNLVLEGYGTFDVTDIGDAARGRVQIHEVSYQGARGMLFGYGFRYRADGTLGIRPVLAVPLRTDELPAPLLERLALT